MVFPRNMSKIMKSVSNDFLIIKKFFFSGPFIFGKYLPPSLLIQKVTLQVKSCTQVDNSIKNSKASKRIHFSYISPAIFKTALSNTLPLPPSSKNELIVSNVLQPEHKS